MLQTNKQEAIVTESFGAGPRFAHVILTSRKPTQTLVNEIRFEQDHQVTEDDGFWVAICPGLDDLEICLDENSPFVRVPLTETAQARFEEILLPLITRFNAAKATLNAERHRGYLLLTMAVVRARRKGEQDPAFTDPELEASTVEAATAAKSELITAIKAYLEEFEGEIGETPETIHKLI